MSLIGQKQLTVDDALAQGYTKCSLIWQEINMIDIEKCDFKANYILIDKETHPYQISETLIQELVCDHLERQEDVSDENCKLKNLALECDYSDITKQINEKFLAIKYFAATDILLIPNKK